MKTLALLAVGATTLSPLAAPSAQADFKAYRGIERAPLRMIPNDEKPCDSKEANEESIYLLKRRVQTAKADILSLSAALAGAPTLGATATRVLNEKLDNLKVFVETGEKTISAHEAKRALVQATCEVEWGDRL